MISTLKSLKCLSSFGQRSSNVLKFSPEVIANNSQRFSSTYASTLPDIFYNDEQKEMQATFRKIIDTDINPFIDAWEEKEQFPSKEVFKKLGNAGLLGVDKPVEYGGMGLDYKYHAAVLEEAGYMDCGAIPMAYMAQTTITLPALARFGSHELKKQFLEPSIKGDFVACLGVTEPSAGSDVANIKTNAVRKGDDLIINGQKMFITNGLQADWICLLANTSQGNRHTNKSLICVPMNSKGITKTKIHKIGMNSSDTAQIFFEDVRVPASNIIGDEGNGFLYQMLQFQDERLAGVLVALKGVDKVISNTIDYTRQRHTFGTPIIDNQVVHFRLAELATEFDSLRALTYNAVDAMVAGEDVTRLASMAKLKAGRLLREVADSCLQYYGGMGYARETHISRFYRDTRLFSIGAGADEIMLGIICKLMGTLPSPKKKTTQDQQTKAASQS